MTLLAACVLLKWKDCRIWWCRRYRSEEIKNSLDLIYYYIHWISQIRCSISYTVSNKNFTSTPHRGSNGRLQDCHQEGPASISSQFVRNFLLISMFKIAHPHHFGGTFCLTLSCTVLLNTGNDLVIYTASYVTRICFRCMQIITTYFKGLVNVFRVPICSKHASD